jgi:hypothetical protein
VAESLIRSFPAVAHAKVFGKGRNIPLDKSFKNVYAGTPAVPFDEVRIIAPVKLPGTENPPPDVLIVPTDKLPDMFAVPLTSNVKPGVGVAIPTFPFDRIRIRSVPVVANAKLLTAGRNIPLVTSVVNA